MRFICATDPRSQACGLSGQPGGIVDDLNVEALEYVTLSYVRGSPTDEEWDHNGLPEVLPPLLTDAIAVTKSLGFRYLWIDRFCFPQYNAHERRRQLEKMGEIYARSAFTIIVAAGQGVQDGIPGISMAREEQLSLQTEAGCFTTSLTRPDVEVANSKWASRGWTYQEGLLSRRRLTKPALNLGRVFPDNGAGGRTGDFRNIVSGYVSREFSFPEDRLDAFRGILDNPTRTDRLAVGLGWLYDPPGNADISTHPLQLQGPFPSWSWLGWKLRPEYTGHGPNLSFYQVGEEAPVVDNISAVPNMTISIGFKDDKILCWETEGDEIAARSTPITFLRLTTYCFEIRLTVPSPATSSASTSSSAPAITLTSPDLLDAFHSPIAALLLRAAQSSPESPSELPPGEHELIGAFISGRDWKVDESYDSASVLICGRRTGTLRTFWFVLAYLSLVLVACLVWTRIQLLSRGR
ncbi:hypothetical protein ACKAV7_004786 [Fusarium commune]